jgi:mRNA interferase MazF
MGRSPSHQRHAFAVWDVARVAFPFADSPIHRNRPALVISTPDVHERFGVLWVLMITSAERTRWPGDITISDLAEAGLPVPCVVRTEKIATIDTRFAELAGRLSEQDRADVVRSLRRLLDSVLVVS